jgi:hypothetical protein
MPSSNPSTHPLTRRLCAVVVMSVIAVVAVMVVMATRGKCRGRDQQQQRDDEKLLHGSENSTKYSSFQHPSQSLRIQ